MKWFFNMKIATKLIIAFILVAIIAGAVGLVGIMNVQEIDHNGHILYENMTVPLSEAAEMAKLFQRIRVNTRDMILEDEPEKIDQMYNNIKSIIDQLNELSVSFEEKALSDDMKKAFADFMETRANFGAMLDDYYELCIENKDDEAYALIKGDMRVAADAEKDAIDLMVTMKVDDAREKAEENDALTSSAITVMTVLITVAIIIAIALGIFISRIISRPLRKMVTVANKISNGDLDVTIDIDTKDEIGSLGKALSVMTYNLNNVMANINTASDQVAAGSNQVSDSSMSLSQGATEQASSIEELSASIEQISGQTKLNASNAEEAENKANTTKEIATQGNQQMTEMLTAMNDINESSSNISRIIKVIDEIAFQTNILALNAAVEAARAGEHGKGFAVVAEEVRNLAARSADAARETTTMIEGSIDKVNNGTDIANRTAEALSEIVDGISTVTELVSQIAVASNEQALGVDQINQGIIQISNVVQSTSATAQETAAASEELSSQADLLKQEVSTFKLKTHNTGFTQEEKVNDDVAKMLTKMQSQSNNSTLKISLSDDNFDKY